MKISSLEAAAIAYGIAVVACFGPASVEEDALEAAERIECDARPQEIRSHCRFFARNEMRPVIKAMMWPFWLSHRIAANTAKEQP